MLNKGFRNKSSISRILRRVGISVGVTVLVLAIIVGGTFLWALTATDSSLLARGIIWGDSDVDDWQRFPSRPVEASLDPLYFSTVNQNQITEAINGLKVDDTIPLVDYLEKSDTTAFIIIHGNELVYEKYFNGSSSESTITCFSAAKSFLSTLVGIAISEGCIGGLDDPVTRYIPELLERDERFVDITIRHLLTMSSGLRFKESFSPWSDPSKTYYSPDLRAVALSSEIVESPGTRFIYNDYNPLLIGLVLERATSVSVAEYLETKLWQPMGAEGDGSWSLDSEQSGFEKMNTGINGRAIDFAKLGWLFLNEGRNGEIQAVPSDWVEEATRLDTTADPAAYYQYFWWIDEDHNAYWAEGNHGQYIYVYPDADLVLVRMSRTGEAERGHQYPLGTTFLLSVAQWLQEYL
jgi:CubicO group peptidase (beta-lactamase class C family)